MQMRSAHSWISITDNISRPFAFDLKSFLKGERALLALVERSWKHWPDRSLFSAPPDQCAGEVCTSDHTTIWRINITGMFWTDSSDMVIKFIRNLSRIDYWYFIYFLFLRTNAKYVQWLSARSSWNRQYGVKAVLIICLHSLSYFRIYHIVLFFKISTNQRNRWINML